MKGTDWRALERAVARVLIHCGWRDVAIIGQAGDMGADIVGWRSTNGRIENWVVQVKAVSRGGYVGVAAVDEVIRALGTYRADVAAVATNGEFTSSATRRRDDLTGAQFALKLWNGSFLRDLLARWGDYSADKKQLRNYQSDIVDKVISAHQSGSRRTHFIVATGLGKTTIASEISSNLYSQGLTKQLVLCHTQDLALQLEQGMWSRLSRDVPTSYFFGGRPPLMGDGVTVGLYQTLEGYLSSVDPGMCDLVVVDEAHHALSPSFRNCIQHLSPRLTVGMTATPWRSDGSALDDLFGEPVARVSLIDGMLNGFLAEVDYRIFVDNLNWDEIPNLSKKRLGIRDLNKRLFLPQRDEAVIAEIKKACGEVHNGRIAIFSPSIQHSHAFAAALRAHGISCEPLSGLDRVQRRQNLLDFTAGRISAVTAVDVLNEGIDVPDVNILVFMRATHSRRIFIQQLGRGLRLAPGKSKVIVLDFVSDLRRLADLSSMDAAYRTKMKGREDLLIKDHIVSFSNAEAENFVQEWIRDAADLETDSGDFALDFPIWD